MTKLEQAAQQALEALETLAHTKAPSVYNSARDALRAALAEPQPEPVAWRVRRSDGQHELYFFKATAKRAAECYIKPPQVEPLYTTPPQRKPLTEEEILKICQSFTLGFTDRELARAIERAHGIGGDK